MFFTDVKYFDRPNFNLTPTPEKGFQLNGQQYIKMKIAIVFMEDIVVLLPLSCHGIIRWLMLTYSLLCMCRSYHVNITFIISRLLMISRRIGEKWKYSPFLKWYLNSNTCDRSYFNCAPQQQQKLARLIDQEILINWVEQQESSQVTSYLDYEYLCWTNLSKLKR